MSKDSILVDPGSYVNGALGDSGITGTAGGGGSEGVEVSGAWVDPTREAYGSFAAIAWEAVLADTRTFALTANARTATDSSGTGAVDFKNLTADGADGVGKQTLTSLVVANNTTGGGATFQGVTIVRFPDIRAHIGFLQLQLTADLSAASVDTFEAAVVWFFSGQDTVPVAVTVANS